MNSKERRFLRRLPDDLKEVLASLPEPVSIESFTAFGRSWEACVQCGGRLFRLVSGERDLGYIDVSEFVRNVKRPEYRTIMPPESQRLEITPAQVGELIRRELAEKTGTDVSASCREASRH